jgi:hypothetical protein
VTAENGRARARGEAIIFTGPTISAGEARAHLDAVYLPPAAQGDVYRAIATREPGRRRAVGIVDGYFDRVPAVWHKEILWAMTQGIHVFGSASMGALRAAELQAFGMEGVGPIYEAFRDGTLEDDDEVAVAHGPPEAGYRGQSEAMVNVRATVMRAEEEGVVDARTRSALERITKGLFYADRSYLLVVRLAAEEGIDGAQLAAFTAWLPRGRVDQKRCDAIAMLRLMRCRLEQGLPPKRVSFAFEHTVYWERARIAAMQAAPATDPTGTVMGADGIFDELLLEGRYPQAGRAALGRVLAVEEARRHGLRAGDEALRKTMEAVRRERGLLTVEAAREWCEANDMEDEALRRFLADEALLRWTQSHRRYETASQLMDSLRSSGDYARLAARARDKNRALEARGLERCRLADAGLTEEELYRWYFKERLNRPQPADLPGFARRQGFADVSAFRRALLREYLYVTGC